MNDLISRKQAIDEISRWLGYLDDDMILRIQIGLKKLPSAQSNVPDTNAGDTISRQAVIDAIFSEPLYKSGMKKRDVDVVVPAIYEKIKSLPSVQPEKQHGRIFQEIIVEYPSYNTYPEYKGKPYFSIKYTENGQGFIGYGTYKPEVLSEYLKEYFMPSAQPEEAIPVSWIESRIERFVKSDDAFSGLTASIIRVMLNEWKREQEGDTT